jgi:hypothetical protein
MVFRLVTSSWGLEPDCVLLDSDAGGDYGQSWDTAAWAHARGRPSPVVMFTAHIGASREADEGTSEPRRSGTSPPWYRSHPIRQTYSPRSPAWRARCRRSMPLDGTAKCCALRRKRPSVAGAIMRILDTLSFEALPSLP